MVATTEFRVYEIKHGKLDAWVRLFLNEVKPLREREGFHIDAAFAIPERDEFVWIVTYEGDADAMRRADAAYYELPEHAPLHQEALLYLEGGSQAITMKVV